MATRHILRLVEKTKPLLRHAKGNRRWNPSCQNHLKDASSVSPTRRLSFLAGLDGGKEKDSLFSSTSRGNRQCPTAASSGSTLMPRRGLAAAADLPAYQEIGMPSLSPTMTQGNIAKWRKKVGDSVAAGDVLCEIETDKATLEMESMEDGFMARILLEDGAKDIPVGQAIAIMVENEEDIPKFAEFTPGSEAPPPPPPKEASSSSPSPPPPPPVSSAQEESTQTAPAPPPAPGAERRTLASPAARKLAEDKKVDIAQIKGTGPDGRIVKADIEDYLAKGPAPRAQPAAMPLPAPVPPMEGLNYTDLPNTQIRKIIAQRLLQSKQTIPHYYLTVDVKMDKLSKLRQELNALQAKAGGKKISVNDFVIKAAALALKKVPQCNASWTDDFIRQYHNVDITVAVQTDFGLMVPIVKDADKKGLATISDEVKSLAEKARENKLRPDEFQGGTFAISNLGMYGVKSFAAIINPPQACILAVGCSTYLSHLLGMPGWWKLTESFQRADEPVWREVRTRVAWGLAGHNRRATWMPDRRTSSDAPQEKQGGRRGGGQ